MSKTVFVVQPQLTAITLAYRNEAMIADQVLPRISVLSPEFKWSKYTLADGFTIPNTRVGRKGRVSEIDWSATEQTDSVADYGLDDVIPQYDLNAAAAAPRVAGVMPIDPRARTTELLSGLVALDRELRVSSTVFALATYPSTQRTTLAGTAQWSDYANSDPATAILTALDAMLVRANILVLGRAVWSKLRQHPKITAAVFPGGGNASVAATVADRAAVARLLELDEIIVGEGWYNSAKPGQTPTMVRLWGKHAALLHRNQQVQSTQGGITFGYTAEYLTRVSGTIEQDPNVGLRGGERVRVGESVKEVIAANDGGYFFENAVA